jgi:hypothetical protein
MRKESMGLKWGTMFAGENNSRDRAINCSSTLPPLNKANWQWNFFLYIFLLRKSHFHFFHIKNHKRGLGTVAQTYNSSYSGGGDVDLMTQSQPRQKVSSHLNK